MESSQEFKTPLELYTPVLEQVCQLYASEDIVSAAITDGENLVFEPVKIGEKTLHLPTPEFLKNPDWDNYVAFHPLSESPMRGESEVLRVMRRYMVSNFNSVLAIIMEGLIRVAADTDGHKRLSAAASECLDAVPKADKNSVTAMGKVLAQMDKESVSDMSKIIDTLFTTGRRKLVNFYLKRPGEYKGKEYSRVCVVEFPFLSADAIDEDNRTIFGVKLRVNDFKGFRKLFGFIVATMESSGETYNAATNSMTVPYLTVLLESWFKLAERLNKVIATYKKHIPELKDLKFDVSWKSALDDLASLSRMIPPLEGNIGVNEQGAQAQAAPKVSRNLNAQLVQKEERRAPAQTMVQEQIVATQPQLQPQAAPEQPTVIANKSTVDTGTVSWKELQAANQPRNQFQQQQPVQQLYQQVMPGGGRVVMGAPQTTLIRQQPVIQVQQQNWGIAALTDPQPVQQLPGNQVQTTRSWGGQQQQQLITPASIGMGRSNLII